MKSRGVTIQMKATEQSSPEILFIMKYTVVLTLFLWIKCKRVTIQMIATVQQSPVMLFVVLYKVIVTFDSVNLKAFSLCSTL